MNTYVNRFAFAINNYKDEVVLSFLQENPSFAEDGSISGVQLESVSNLVMSNRLAHELSERLLEALDSETFEEPEYEH